MLAYGAGSKHRSATWLPSLVLESARSSVGGTVIRYEKRAINRQAVVTVALMISGQAHELLTDLEPRVPSSVASAAGTRCTHFANPVAPTIRRAKSLYWRATSTSV